MQVYDTKYVAEATGGVSVAGLVLHFCGRIAVNWKDRYRLGIVRCEKSLTGKGKDRQKEGRVVKCEQKTIGGDSDPTRESAEEGRFL
ncbi:hypothetical protein TNCV_4144161 [Trichonephila clavipes]|nr:hypothetical protein TNCV_4144161 [Trichonephila clavipes]